MSSIQERLQLKRVPLDTWNIREQLCLASAVVRSGDQNWMSVSRALKTVGDANKPADWYSQKSCAAQYGALLEHVETPKRKKRSSEGAGETPQESILKRLTDERIVEIQKSVAEMNQQYEQIKKEMVEARNPATSEERLREMWAEIEAAKRARERENARRAAWLKEREERRARAERTWRPPTQPAPGAVPPSAMPSSPLLTSLLKSAPVVTTPQHMSHPANVHDAVSPSAGAPTLSMLLEKAAVVTAVSTAMTAVSTALPTVPTAVTAVTQDSKHAAIEHIKSQLVQIEHQLRAQPAVPAVDIDDIEIKAEDVYAFSDIELAIAPDPPRSPEKQVFTTKDEDDNELNAESQAAIHQPSVEPESMEIDPVPIAEDRTPVIETVPLAPEPDVADTSVVEFEPLPAVKFPTPEIKVLQQETVKKESLEPEPAAEPDNEQVEDTIVDVDDTPAVTERSPPPPSPSLPPRPVPVSLSSPAWDDVTHDTGDIPLPPEDITTDCAATDDAATEPPPPLPEPAPEMKEEPAIPKEEQEIEESRTEETVVEDVKEDNEPEGFVLLNDETTEDLPPETDTKEEPEIEETHTETDDDTPMELSREEEKDGKKRRDYSRKKKPDSRTCSGSESATEASAPESPSASGTDAERQHRLWKKSVMLVYSRLCAHKYASIFLRRISDDEAPGYSLVIKRPMDLTAIRRNIDAGLIRTTAEFQRDVLLMLTNALMYNSSNHSVYNMAKEMHEEAMNQLSILVAAQAHAGLVAPSPPPRRKRRRDSPTRRPL